MNELRIIHIWIKYQKIWYSALLDKNPHITSMQRTHQFLDFRLVEGSQITLTEEDPFIMGHTKRFLLQLWSIAYTARILQHSSTLNAMSAYNIVIFFPTPEKIRYEVIRIPHYKSEGILRNPLGEQYVRKVHRCTAANETHE